MNLGQEAICFLTNQPVMVESQLQMELPSLEGITAPMVPDSYRLRAYCDGDAAAWCRLVNEGIGGDYTGAWFLAEINQAPGFQPKDLLFVEYEGEAIGTAWALRKPDLPSDIGYLHMVAIDPQHRGRGLGRALVQAVLGRFRELNCNKVMLHTDDFRLPAIGLYLSLGFRPQMIHESHASRWQEVFHKLDLQNSAIYPWR